MTVEHQTDPGRFQGIGLSFIGGYVDTVSFVALFGLFAAHVTGNFVLIGSELVHPSHGVLIKFLAFPAFITGVAVTRLFAVWMQNRGITPLRPILLLQLVLLAGFMVLGILASPIGDAEATLVLAAGAMGAAAMGVQNAASRLVLQNLTATTVMTGNVTQLVIDVVDMARGAADEATRQRGIKFLWPIVAFAAGAIGGAYGYIQGHFLALLVPIGLLALIALRSAAPGTSPAAPRS